MAILLMSFLLVIGGCRSEGAEPEIGTDAAAAACDEPPQTIGWNGKPYALQTLGNENLEPGMKLGAILCENGVFTQRSEGENAVFNIYTYGSPLESDELLFFGTWGRALYTPADERSFEHRDEEKSAATEPVVENPTAEKPVPKAKPERRDIKLDAQPNVESAEAPTSALTPEEVRAFRLDPRLEKEWAERKQPMRGLFETTVETEKADGKFRIRFSLKNVSDRDLTVVYGSGQKYDFWILNEQNEEVYRWSHDLSFIAVILREELPKSGRFDFEEEWNGLDNDARPVPPGTYTLVVKMAAGLESGHIDQEELTAKTQIEVTESDFPVPA